jgi:hypothetical protein
VCAPTAKKAVLNVDDLAGMLASGDVKVTSGAQAQDIEINAALSWTSTQRLTLDAYHSIAFNKPVVVAGTGAMTITTDDGGSGGDFNFAGKGHVEFWDTSSNLVINGQTYFLLKSIQVLAHIKGVGTGYHFAQPKDWHIAGNRKKSPLKEYDGALEGLGNKIAHLTINSADAQVGLFEDIDSNALVRDVTLTSVDITGSGFRQVVGGLAGGSDGTVINCHVSGKIVATVQNSIVGGLLGANDGTVVRSSAAVSVTANDGVLYSGGLIGHNVFGGSVFVAAVRDSFATGSVTGGLKVGGLIGETDVGVIANSYATGAVTGSASASVGGFIGFNALGLDDENTPTSIAGSYSTGAVSGGDGAVVGGYIGTDTVQLGIASSYWDLDSSGIGDPAQGAGNVGNDPGITGLTDTQLKSGLPSGFDKKVWKQQPDINNGYPTLIDNAPSK